MSASDYRFKEIPVDPSLLDSRFPGAPIWGVEDEEIKERRAAALRSRMRKVRRAMEEYLTPRQRECLELYYLRGLSQKRIATLLQIHQTTVSQHILYALKKLRQILSR